jgi:HSP20 family molecular chaperone IbpA
MSEEKSLEKTERATAERVQQPRPATVPPVDVYENAEHLLLVADLPGVSKEALNVSIDKGQLTIEGKRAASPPGNALSTEFRARDYRRTFAVPSGIDATAITAELDRGVLRLTLPKSAALKPRKIEIKAS